MQRQFLLEHERAGGNGRQDRIAVPRQRGERGDVAVLERATASRSPSSSFGMPQQASFFDEHVRDLVVREHRQQVVADAGLVVVDVAGGEDRHLAGRARAVLHRQATTAARARGIGAGVIGRHAAPAVTPSSLVHQLAGRGRRVDRVHDLHDDRDRRELAQRDRCSTAAGRADRALPLPELRPPSRAASGAGSPRSTDAAARTGTWSCSTCRTGSTGRRPSRSRSFATPSTSSVALVVDQIEQRRKRRAQVHAAAAAVADVEDPLELVLERRLVVELRVLPVERMPRGRLRLPSRWSVGVERRCGEDHGWRATRGSATNTSREESQYVARSATD